jgi:hypothetical protein
MTQKEAKQLATAGATIFLAIAITIGNWIRKA